MADEGAIQVRDELTTELKKNRNHHFSKEEEGDCGEKAVESILSMYDIYSQQDLNSKEGTSPQKIRKALRSKNIQSEIRDGIGYEKLKPRSIVYYPEDDHYVTVEKIQDNKILVNDSSKEKSQWLSRKNFEKLWNDWAIETRRS